MTGCWMGRGERGETVIEERWTSPEGGMMLGTTRFFRDGEVVSFEFGVIRASEAGIHYLPYPDGRPSEHAFRLTRSSLGRATFEAPEHDYPKRISYERAPEGTLAVRIDGGEGDSEPRRWALQAVSCAGFPAM